MKNRNSQTSVQEFVLNLAYKIHVQLAKSVEFSTLQIHLTTEVFNNWLMDWMAPVDQNTHLCKIIPIMHH